MIKQKTYLPCFLGFYETRYYNDDYLLDEQLEHLNINTDKTILKWFENNFYEYIEYSKIHNDISQHYIDYMNTIDSNIQFEFENLHSPKYYNYSNDIINVLCKIKNFKKLYSFLIENKTEFEKYIKLKYTSYDGFFSYYSNDYNEWLSLLKNPKNKDLTHELGAILEFYYELNYDDIDFKFYYYLSDNFYISDYINYNDMLKDFNSEFSTDFNYIDDIFLCNSITKQILKNINLENY